MSRSHLVIVLALATVGFASPALAQAPSPQVVYLVPGPVPGTWVQLGSASAAVPAPAATRPVAPTGVPRRPFSFDLTGGSSALGGSGGSGDGAVDGITRSRYSRQWAPSVSAQLLFHFDGTVGGPSIGVTVTSQIGPHPSVQLMGRTGYDFAVRLGSRATMVVAPYVAFGSFLETDHDTAFFVFEGGLDLRTYFGDSFHVLMRGLGGYAFDGANGRFNYFGVLGGIGLSF